MPIEVMLLTVIKALIELAGLFLLGQGLLYILAGQKRDGNFVYQLFRTLTSPVMRFTRSVTPRFVIDRHIPFVAFLLVFWAWLICLYLLAQACQATGFDCKTMKTTGVPGPIAVTVMSSPASGV